MVFTKIRYKCYKGNESDKLVQDIENILMIRRSAIGDIVSTLPAYYMMKANFPNSKIDFLVTDSYSYVLKGFPGLGQVLTIEKKVLTSKNIPKLWRLAVELRRTIKKNNYQLVVDFSGHAEHAVLLWLSGIKHRWGMIEPGKPVRSLFYTNTFTKQTHGIHKIDQNLKLLEKGGLKFFPIKNQYIIPQENLEKAKALFNGWGLSLQKPALFIQPFTGDGIAGKIWPLDRYVALAEHWKNQGMQVLFGGGPSEREQLNEVATRFPVAAGQSDFLTSVGLVMLSSIVVGGDTGLMHAASAVGKRSVMILGPTDYEFICPYKHPEWAVKPQEGNLIEIISVEEVILATETAFKELSERN